MIAATPARGAIASAKSKGIGERQHGERSLGGDAELAMTQPPALNLCAKSTFNQFLEVILAGTICDRVMRSISAYQASPSRESSDNLVLPFRGLAESIIASETDFESGCISCSQRRLRMKKASIIAAAVLLIGSSAVSYAAGPQNGSHGASGFAPGTRMQTTTPAPQDRGAVQGASQLTPAFQMKDTTPAAPSGASTFTPGHKK